MRPALLVPIRSVMHAFRVFRRPVRVSAAVFMRDDCVLLVRRAPDGPAPLKWQFPGGKARGVESGRRALYRELAEEVGITVSKCRLFLRTWVRDPDFSNIFVSFYIVDDYDGIINAKEDQELRWVPVNEAAGYDLMDSNDAALQQLIADNKAGNEFVWDQVWNLDSVHYGNANTRTQRVTEKLKSIRRLGFSLGACDVVLDVGCGSAAALSVIREMFPLDSDSSTLIGVDRSTVVIKRYADQTDSRTKILNADVTSLPFESRSIDVILAFNIVEHVADIDAFLGEMQRVLTVGGEIFFSQSNSLSIVSVDRQFRRLFGIWRYGYQRNLSPQALSRIVGRYFLVEEMRVDPPNADAPVLRAIDIAINHIWHYWGRNIFIRARKA